MKHNAASYRLIVDGNDYSDTVEKRLRTLTLTEKLEGGADTLDVTLWNHDGQLAPIKRGVYVSLAIGWQSGPEVTLGLVEKGQFLVDQVTKEGPPDVVRFTARSADLTKGFRKRRDKGWKGMTIAAVVADVAAANGLQPRVHADLASIEVGSVEQAAKSDIAFIRALGERYDAVATVKNRSLVFMPIGSDTTAGGEALEGLTLARRENSRFTFTIADREEADGAEAQWHDREGARKRTVKHGGEKNPRRLKRTFATEGEAAAAAKAATTRAARGQYTFTYEAALGDAAMEPNRKVTVQGFDSEIDGIRWLITQATHTVDGGGGFSTSLEMESVDQGRTA